MCPPRPPHRRFHRTALLSPVACLLSLVAGLFFAFAAGASLFFFVVRSLALFLSGCVCLLWSFSLCAYWVSQKRPSVARGPVSPCVFLCVVLCVPLSVCLTVTHRSHRCVRSHPHLHLHSRYLHSPSGCLSVVCLRPLSPRGPLDAHPTYLRTYAPPHTHSFCKLIRFPITITHE